MIKQNNHKFYHTRSSLYLTCDYPLDNDTILDIALTKRVKNSTMQTVLTDENGFLEYM